MGLCSRFVSLVFSGVFVFVIFVDGGCIWSDWVLVVNEIFIDLRFFLRFWVLESGFLVI